MSTFPILPNAPKVFSEKFKIRSYHTDVNQKLTLPKLCSFFQEIAGSHSTACGIGWKALSDANLFWVLSRLKISVTEMPRWETEIEIRTWTNGVSGVFAIRHYLVLDAEGNELISAISLWLLLNIESRRIARPAAYIKSYPICDDWLIGPEPEKIGEIDAIEMSDVQSVTFTEIDMNKHMNNVSYIERMLNSYSFDFMISNSISAFEINFLREAKINDQIQVHSNKNEAKHKIGIVSEDLEIEYIRATFEWKTI